MSLVVPEQTKVWLLTGIAAAAALIVTILVLGTNRPGRPAASADDPKVASVNTKAPPPQAKWKITTHVAGVPDEVTKAQARAVARQGPALVALVKDVYDALFLHRDRLSEELKQNFNAPAARAFRRSGAGAARAGVASTSYRSAEIGIGATDGARLAVASVSIRASAEKTGAGRFLHRSTLWLKRAHADWKVIAFTVNQAPLPAGAQDEKKGRGGGGNKPDGKNGSTGSDKKGGKGNGDRPPSRKKGRNR